MLTRFGTLICTAILITGVCPSRAAAADPFNDLADQTNKKLVKLFGAGGFSRLNNFGTGIIISKDGYVLTVASQLLDTSDLVVHLYDGQRLKAQVVVVEPVSDAAIVKIRAEGRSWKSRSIRSFVFRFRRGRETPHAEVGISARAPTPSRSRLRDEPLSLQRGVVMAYAS